MTPQEVTDALRLKELKDKIWNVVPSCATTGEGLLDGLVSRLLSPSSPDSPPTPFKAS
jgi:ADP-ribosylation factor 6